MKRVLCAVAVASALIFGGPANAQVATLCLNCAVVGVQVEEAAQNVWRWAQNLFYQVQQFEQMVQSVQYAVVNLMSLPQRLINDITSPIYQAQALVRQAEMLGQQTKFMISHLSAGGGYGGYGGSLQDIEPALREANFAVSNAMQQFGLVSRQVASLSSQCAAQYAAIDSWDPSGGKAAIMAGTTMAATSGQCAEARAQRDAAYQNAMLTAELRRAHQEAMVMAASQAHLDATLRSTCAALAAGGGRSRACEQ